MTDQNVAYLVEQLLAAIERRSAKLNELAQTTERMSGRIEALEAERNGGAQAPDPAARYVQAVKEAKAKKKETKS